MVPDLICILDTDSGRPITTEEQRYGLRVTVIVLAPSPMLTTRRALQLVGPKAFHYENLEYRPYIDLA